MSYQPPPGGYGPPPAGWPPPGPPQGYPMAQVPAAPMFQCPMCRATAPPIERSNISTAGWVIFIACLLFCVTIPFCWIGLLQKDRYRVCGHCNHNLGPVG